MDEKIPTVVILRIGTDQTSIVRLVQLFLILNTGYVSIENLFRITVASTVFGNAEMFDVSDFAILSDAKIGSISDADTGNWRYAPPPLTAKLHC